MEQLRRKQDERAQVGKHTTIRLRMLAAVLLLLRTPAKRLDIGWTVQGLWWHSAPCSLPFCALRFNAATSCANTACPTINTQTNTTHSHTSPNTCTRTRTLRYRDSQQHTTHLLRDHGVQSTFQRALTHGQPQRSINRHVQHSHARHHQPRKRPGTALTICDRSAVIDMGATHGSLGCCNTTPAAAIITLQQQSSHCSLHRAPAYHTPLAR